MCGLNEKPSSNGTFPIDAPSPAKYALGSFAREAELWFVCEHSTQLP